MLSPQLRGKVDGLWNMFWSAGMTNPWSPLNRSRICCSCVNWKTSTRFASIPVSHPFITRKWIRVEEGRSRLRCLSMENIRQKPTFALLNDIVFPWLRNLEKWLKESAKAEKEKKGKNKGNEVEEEDSLPRSLDVLMTHTLFLTPTRPKRLVARSKLSTIF